MCGEATGKGVPNPVWVPTIEEPVPGLAGAQSEVATLNFDATRGRRRYQPPGRPSPFHRPIRRSPFEREGEPVADGAEERPAPDHGFVKGTIADSALFIGLSEGERDDIAAFAEPLVFAPGTCIVREGEPGDALFLLAEGTVEIVTGEGTPHQKVVARLSGGSSLQAGYAGAFFGEMSLIDVEPRSATVRAQTDVKLVRLPAPALRQYYQTHRDAHLAMVSNLARSLSRRLRLLTESV